MTLFTADALKTICQGALGAVTFGAYHQFTTNKIMELNNEKMEIKHKYFINEIEVRHKKEMNEMECLHKKEMNEIKNSFDDKINKLEQSLKTKNNWIF